MSTVFSRRALRIVGRGFFALASALIFSAGAVGPQIASADPPPPQLISADANGATHDGTAQYPKISADGSIIAFTSNARLTASAPVGSTAYVYDQRTNQFIWNSQQDPSVTAFIGNTYVNDISADGRLVLFYSSRNTSGNLTGSGIFVHNLETGVTTQVSLGVDGTPMTRLEDTGALNASMSPNGHYAVFTNNVFDGNGGHPHLYLRDLVANTTEDIVTPEQGVLGGPEVSNDGRYIAYTTQYGTVPVVVYDRVLGQDIATPTNARNGGSGVGLRMAGDGSSVIYFASPTSFDGQPTADGPGTHIFRMTIPDGTVTDITPTTDVNVFSEGKGDFSPDGSTFTFDSQIPLTSETNPGEWGTYAYNIATGTYTFIAKSTNSTWYYAGSTGSDVSNNGDVVAYTVAHETESYYSNLYVQTFNGWTPPAATWTPLPWDNTAPDLTPPILTADVDPLVWYNAPTTVHFTCVDPGNGTLTPPDPQTFSEDGVHTFESSCIDAQGNVANPNWTISIDQTAPGINDDSVDADSPAGTAFNPNRIAGDLWSGLASVSCDVAAGAVLSVGAHSVTCNATDIAGNTSTATITVTVQPWHQATMGVLMTASKTHNKTGNDRSAANIIEEGQIFWGDTIVISTNVGSGAGTVKCKDSQGNNYTKLIDRTVGSDRVIVCSAAVTTALHAGDTVTITYPSFDGASAMVVNVLRGLDTPSTEFDKSYRSGTGTALTTGKANVSGTRLIAFGVMAYDGNGTLTLPGDWNSMGTVSAGTGASKRTLVPVYKIVMGSPAAWYRTDGTFSKSTAWQAVLSTWLGQNSGPDPS